MSNAKKITAGRYELNGYQIARRMDGDAAYNASGWDLISPAGEWCNVFATKRDALEAARELSRE